MLVLKVCVGKYAHERFFYLSSVSYQNSHHVSVKSLQNTRTNAFYLSSVSYQTPIMLVLRWVNTRTNAFTSLQFHTKTPIMLVLKVCVGNTTRKPTRKWKNKYLAASRAA